MSSNTRNDLILRMLTDALDYFDYDPGRSKALLRRVIYWLEDDYGEEEKEREEGSCDW